MKKRIISGIAAVVLTFSGAGTALANIADLHFEVAASAADVAESGTCGENLTWTLDKKGTLTISGTGDMPDHGISTNAPWWESKDSIKKVIIEKGVTGIGGSAFYSCKNLTEITIPDSVKSIGNYAFSSCESLTDITIPNGVSRIDEFAFEYCTSLTEMTLPESITYIDFGTFDSCNSLEKVTLPDGIKYIGDHAFLSCRKLKSINIPESVEHIGELAFASCKSLMSITIPNADTRIYSEAFSYMSDDFRIICRKDSAAEKYAAESGIKYELIKETADSGECGENLTWTLDKEGTLTISGTGAMTDYDELTELENLNKNVSPWAGNSAVKKVIIGNDVTSIGKASFMWCTDLTSVTIPDSVTSINFGAFRSCTGLKSITIPDSVTSIGYGAFTNCTSLESIAIPDSVTDIGEFAFNRCTNLEQITLSNNLKSIGAYTFLDCGSLESITIPNSVTAIGYHAFCNCKNLKSIYIPDGVESIGSYAFSHCQSLTSATIQKSVTSFGTNIFDHTADNFRIYCYKNSAAEQYAKDNGFEYELIGDTTVPDITAVPDYNEISLTWTTVPDAEDYAVCGLINGKWQKLAVSADTSYVLTGLKRGTEYTIAVIARVGGEWNADISNAVTTATKGYIPAYPTVTNIEHNAQYHRFRLNWNAVNGATEYGIAVKIANKWKVQTYTTKTTFTSPKLKPGSTVEIVICAKVNGKWDTSDINRRAFTVTVK